MSVTSSFVDRSHFSIPPNSISCMEIMIVLNEWAFILYMYFMHISKLWILVTFLFSSSILIQRFRDNIFYIFNTFCLEKIYCFIIKNFHQTPNFTLWNTAANNNLQCISYHLANFHILQHCIKPVHFLIK